MWKPFDDNPYKLHQCTQLRECIQWDIQRCAEILETFQRIAPESAAIPLIKKNKADLENMLETAVNRPEDFEGEGLTIWYNQVSNWYKPEN